MPTINISKDRIIFYQIHGDGEPIVLLHGFMGSSKRWYNLGYINELMESFKVISIDSLGHGNSSKPTDPKLYDNELRANDVISILDTLSINKAHFFGFSMGGEIAFAIGKYHQQRVLSLVIGSIHVLQRTEHFTTYINEQIEWLKLGMENYIDKREEVLGTKLAHTIQTQLLENDKDALVANLMSARENKGMEDILSELSLPILLYVGEKDELYAGVKKCYQILPNASFISLPGLNHSESFEKRNLILPQIIDFLKGS